MPLYGLVHDSPLITAVQKTTRRGRKDAARRQQAVREIDAAIEVNIKILRGLARLFRIKLP